MWFPYELHFSGICHIAKKAKKKDAEMLQDSTCVSSEDPDDALRSLGSVRFVARPWSALFWSGWGWSVCVLSIGAFGVTEVSGLRVFLCEAAALHSPAAPLPWCGASVYLKAECKFTTLVVNQTSGSTKHTGTMWYEDCEAKHDKTWRRSVQHLITFITRLTESNGGQILRTFGRQHVAYATCYIPTPNFS